MFNSLTFILESVAGSNKFSFVMCVFYNNLFCFNFLFMNNAMAYFDYLDKITR